MKPLSGEPLWTHKEAAVYLNVSAGDLYKLGYRGEGPRAFKVGKYLRYDPADVREWLASKLVAA